VDLQTGCQITKENKHLYKNVKKVSFMIFRTGSVLIVGKCDENVLIIIYDFLKKIMETEYKSICQKIKNPDDDSNMLKKMKKSRRKNIIVEFSS
jgi:hypothetical protein